MTRSQSSIQTFGRISKANVEPQSGKKRKASFSSPADITVEVTVQDRKKLRTAPPQTPIDTPTKVISLKFANLELTRRSPTPLPRRKRKAEKCVRFEDTPPTSPCPSQEREEEHGNTAVLPYELEDLRALNAALLTALSLHYAHHGAASPLDVRQLAPSVTKLWGMRTVTLLDVKRCLGLVQKCSIPFQLFDYGYGKICIELQTMRGKGPIAAHFDQERCNQLFEQNLQDAWRQWCDDGEEDDGDARKFIDQLPQASVKLSPTASKTAQAISLARGQKRLEEVLGSRDDDDDASSRKPSKRRRLQAVQPSPSSDPISPLTIPSPIAEFKLPAQPRTPAIELAPLVSTASRSSSLLNRILQKQSALSSLPAPPTAAQSARFSALQRVEEISSMVDLLVSAKSCGPRASFPLQSLTQSIQGSLRSPMSKAEVEKVLYVMEKEGVAGEGYVRMLRMGNVEGVVVDVGRKVGREEARRRIKDALGRL